MKGLQLEARSMPTLVEVIDELYFKLGFSPADGVVTGGATIDATERIAAIDFDNVTIGQWRLNIPTRRRWGACGWKIQVRYTSPVASAATTFAVTYGMRNAEAGMVVPVLADLALSAVVALPGPAVASTLIDAPAWIVPAPVIPMGATEIDLRIIRLPADAADTNVNKLRIYSVRLEILPGPV